MSDKKIAILIFITALVLRLFVLWSFDSEKSLLYVADSLTYLQTAQNMLEHGVYSMEISQAPHPDNFRTPLYPVFLVPFVYLESSLYFPALANALLMSLAAAFVFIFGRKIFDGKVAAGGAFLFALEPIGAIISSQIMAEALFMFFLVPALFELGFYVRDGKRRELFLGALFLALSALVRPVAIWFFVLLPLAARLAGPPKKFKELGIALLIFIGVLSPWVFYNVFILSTLGPYSQSDMALYTYHAKLFSEWLGEPDTLRYVNYNAMEKSFDARVIPEMKRAALELILSRPFEYAWFHLTRIYRLFSDSGLVNVLNGLPFASLHYDAGGGGLLESGNFAALRGKPSLAVLLLADLAIGLISVLAFLNPFFIKKISDENFKPKLFFVFVIIFYALLASPIGGPRLRIPLNPLLFLLALDALKSWYELRFS
ncbi:MAG: hypothetical protein Q8R12_02530 [bacterium]|nr:hypothetical protein [bacterium]